VYTSEYPFVYLTADVVAFSVRPDQGLAVLMVKRRNPPYKGRLAFPGGFVDDREDVERAARRELREEAGIGGRWLRLEQLPAYTAPRRDPRHRVISIPWLAAVPADVTPTAGDDAGQVDWFPVDDLLGSRRLAFDHARILADALERLRNRLEHTALATTFLPPEFTIAELRGVYEEVWGRPLDPGNFQRKVTSSGLVIETGTRTAGGRGRPASLFRAGDAREVWPPMSRSRDR
jgi:8-oxo-dGTP diphosphatase